MRLALPKVIRGIPIQRITAFDINHIANKIYEYNFHERKIDSIPDSQLRTCVIESLKPGDVDGKCDIWTMSPPCQPFTTTAGANRKDHLDNRSKGLFHIMSLLLSIKQLPRWIVLENVKGFIGSEMLQLWLKVMRSCGYSYQQYLLSPDTALGIPNARRRYYFIAEWKGQTTSESLAMELLTSGEGKKESNPTSNESRSSENIQSHGEEDFSDDDYDDNGMKVTEEGNVTTETFEEREQVFRESLKQQGIQTELPLQVKQIFALSMEEPITLEATITRRVSLEEIAHYNHQSELYLPQAILETNWAKKYLSLVSMHARLTYCFTKGYGKLYDHSAGSCLYIHPEKIEAVDWEQLGSYYQQIRLFHPNELLVLFGFPNDYEFPMMVSKKSLLHHYGCIGNSVNVRVVQSVMHCLFC